jgi:hypothetical protein
MVVCIAENYRVRTLCQSPDNNNNNNNSMVSVRERTIPTERPPLVGEVCANFANRGVSRSQRGGYHTAVITVF